MIRGDVPELPTVRRRVVVHGLVQGVFFRDSLRRRADAARVSGWAQNNADGTLEAVFEGDVGEVERLVDFCRRGPRGAVVERIEVFEEEPEGLASFRVS